MTISSSSHEFALLLPHLVAMAFAVAFGASAGSFINVVAWRMSRGLSIVTPPSRCPTCGYRLTWKDNLPIIGYIRLGGKCAACGVKIGPHYLIIEIVMGLLFAAIYALLFLPSHESFWYGVGNGWWQAQGIARAWPALALVLFAAGSLAAMTLSDLRTFLIPTAIPIWSCAVALVGWCVQWMTMGRVIYPWPIQIPSWPWVLAGLFGMVGLAVSGLLLRAGVLKVSFADYDDYVKEGDTFGVYPHSRRELLKEIAFLAAPVLFAVVGYFAGPLLMSEPASATLRSPALMQVLGASAFGLLVGAAIIWFIRIAFTFVFNVEAMGLGDVYLMAAVGAAFGWRAAVVGFVAAPFIGLAFWLVSLAKHTPYRVPFGPSLAGGGFAAFLLWPVCTMTYDGVRVVMARMADGARDYPAIGLVLSVICGAASVQLAYLAGKRSRGVGVFVSGSILLMVFGVVAWVLGSPNGLSVTLGCGVLLAIGSFLAFRMARAHTEEEPGPRTVLARIMLLLVGVILILGVFLAIVTNRQTGGLELGGARQPPIDRVQ